MTQIAEELNTWLQASLSEDSDLQANVASYENNIALARLQGNTLRLTDHPVTRERHILLQMHRGELRLTANDDRIGFEGPAYVDFLRDIQWKSIQLTQGFDASLLLVDQGFFMESTLTMRTKITNGMWNFAQAPFVELDAATAHRTQQMSDLLYNLLASESGPFLREQILALSNLWQYEMWNVFFRQNKHKRTEGLIQWRDIAAHFLYLAHTHLPNRHDVAWYARQIGVSPDTLSATLKRTYGRTAGSILATLLAREAKVRLRNPSLTVQQVAESLGFCDQSSFGKFFKRECGVSPIQYKKEAGKR